MFKTPVGNLKSGTVGAHLDGDIIDEIDRRAAALSMGRSGFAAHVFRWWKSQGYPAVTPADKAMQDLRAAERSLAADEGGKQPRKRAV